jgi:parvulin-like peptidyl-prolyl isomerase
MKRTFLAVALVAVGCGKKAEQQAAQPEQKPSLLHRLPSIEVPPDREEVLVRINDHSLTRADLEERVTIRLGPQADQMSPDQLRLARHQIRRRIMEQHIAQTLLFDAARKSGIEISEDERQMALDTIDERLQSQGKTLEQEIQNGNDGKEDMLQQVIRGLHINKFLAGRLPALPEPTDREIDAVLSTIPETVHARHIILKADSSADEATHGAQKGKAEDLKRQLDEGGDFAALARKHSEGPSAPGGGDLGRFHRGKMVPEFETAAFNQKVGDIGSVVQTKYGYHIIQVLDHIAPGGAPRNEIADNLRAKKRSIAVLQLVRDLMSEAHVTYAESAIPLIPPAFRKTP